MDKSPEMDHFLDELSLIIFGRSAALAKVGGQCVCCGKQATDFKDDLSRKEYDISQLCQTCQDLVFKE